MVKNIVYSFQKMTKDIAESKNPANFYYDGKNLRFITNTDVTTGGFEFEKGNDKVITIPGIRIDSAQQSIILSTGKKIRYEIESSVEPRCELESTYYISNGVYREVVSSDQTIIGHTTTRDKIILFTTDDNGFDAVWAINDETYEIDLLYLRNLDFSVDNPIQAINNYENKLIDKVYWITGKHQVRFINTKHSIDNGDLENLIDVPVSVITLVGKYDLSQPKITAIEEGGQHTSGMIQYAYNLYRLNSSQTKTSPLSELISLDKGQNGGGDINEKVGAIPLIEISNIDEDYTHIKVYSLKYNSYNQIPEVNIIRDLEIPSSREVNIYDDGSIINTSSLEEFTFLGSDILIPKHIISKDNRLFLANYEERNFTVDLDMRAFSFSNYLSGPIEAKVYDDVKKYELGDLTPNINNLTGIQTTITPGNYDSISDKSDAVNLDYDTYKYQADGNVVGGEGKYIKYELYQDDVYGEDHRYFKDSEVYRIGIVFYNIFGQKSMPIWVADFRAQNGNLNKLYNKLKVELKTEFYTWLNTNSFEIEEDIPVGFKVVVAERTEKDKTIISSGIITPMMINDKSSNDTGNTIIGVQLEEYVKAKGETLPKLPNFFVRNTNETDLYGITKPLRRALNFDQMSNEKGTSVSECQRALQGNRDTQGRFFQFNSMYQLYSPEVLFEIPHTMSAGLDLRIKGAYKNTYNTLWGKRIVLNGNTVDYEFKSYQGMSLFHNEYTEFLQQGDNAMMDLGLIGLHHKDQTEFIQHYRGYGEIEFTDVVKLKPAVHITEPILLTGGTDPETNVPVGIDNGEDLGVFYIKDSNDNNIGIKVVTQNNSYYAGYYEYNYNKAIISYTITPNVSNTGNYSANLNGTSNGSYKYDTVSGATGVETLNATLGPYTSRDASEYGEINNNSFYLEITGTDGDEFLIDIVITFRRGDTLALGAVFGISNVPYSIGSFSISNTDFIPSNIEKTYEIYGSPEITGLGQEQRLYNNDGKYKYVNTFESILTDKYPDSNVDNGTYGRSVISMNSNNNRCVTLVLGDESSGTDILTRPMLEDILTDTGLDGDDNIFIAEIVKNREEVYLGNIYGGNGFEDKKRTNYIEIGDYKNLDIASTSILINSPGDTFVQNFRFLRVVRKDLNVISEGIIQMSEMVEYKTETTIDLKNRNDVSLLEWDSNFQSKQTEFHKYNRVYSQMPNLVRHRDYNYNIKRTDGFDTNIIATKVKSPGELIDSWTDIRPSDVLSLDGKYGAINGLAALNDNVFSFQDKAISFISINPRVQIQGDDGISVELGSGQVLQEFKYISTNSGSLNKWGILSTENGIFYLDVLNKSYNILDGQQVLGVSDKEGFHKFFLDNINITHLKQDNPITHKGVSIGWDKVTNDVYLTLFNEGNNITLAYNFAQGGFSSFYDYHSSMYIYTKGKMHTINPSKDYEVYQNFIGDYNKFYGENEKSSISFICNPEPQIECTLNNLEYKSEALLNNTEVRYTWDRIRAYNEFQDSGLIVLNNQFNRGNIRKENRKYRLNIPRDQNKVNRIRNTWSIITLEGDNHNTPNEQNYNYRNHDIILYYNPNYKIIE